MTSSLDSAIRTAATRLDHYIDVHKGQSAISLFDHVQKRRKEIAERAKSFKLIYLDTNAWKCVTDYRHNKPNLTTAMKAFGACVERVAQTGKLAFPIGVPTYFELDSMTNPATRETISQLTDDLSQGFCITSYHDRIGVELQKLRTNKLNVREGAGGFLCSPIELLGIPAISLPGFVKSHVDETTFNKAFFDALSEIPFSIQLEIASNAPGGKWDNSHGIADLNHGKIEHQSEVVNLNTGIFFELKGGIESWFINEGMVPKPEEVAMYAIAAMCHWKEVPSSRALPTMRILSSLYGLMRFDPTRRYQNGDLNDFLVAASALPVAHALFTDRKLAILLSDTRIGLDRFSGCTVVSGFEEMAKYLGEQL